MKKLTKLLLPVSALTLLFGSAEANHIRQDCFKNPLRGFFIGVEGGGDVILAKNSYRSTIVADSTTYRNPIGKTLFGGAGAYGAAIGYSIPFSYGKYAIEPSFEFNQLNGSASAYTNLDNAGIALKTSIELEQQYNFMLALKRLIGNSLTLNLNMGVSVLKTRTKLQSENTLGSRTIQTNSLEDSQYFYGPVLGIGLQYWVSRHSTILFNFNNTFYFRRQLKDEYNVTSGSPISYHSATNRKVFMFMPSFIIRYSYYFATP